MIAGSAGITAEKSYKKNTVQSTPWMLVQIRKEDSNILHGGKRSGESSRNSSQYCCKGLKRKTKKGDHEGFLKKKKNVQGIFGEGSLEQTKDHVRRSGGNCNTRLARHGKREGQERGGPGRGRSPICKRTGRGKAWAERKCQSERGNVT